MLAQIRHRVRDGQHTILPDTSPINDRPAFGKGPGFKLDNGWMDKLKILNPGEKEFRFITGAHTGWVNNEWTTFPVAESLSMGGNYVTVLDQVGPFAKILGVDYFHVALGMTYESHPTLIHKFSCIAADGSLRKPSSGLDVYYPVFSRGEIWMPNEALDFTLTTQPPLPAGTGSPPKDEREVIRKSIAHQRPDVNSPKNFVYYAGDIIVVDEIRGDWLHAPKGWVLAANTMKLPTVE